MNASACNSADPALFLTTDLKKVGTALSYCVRCTVAEECESRVVPKPPAPNSWFDGIAGGKVFRDGQIIARLSSTKPFLIIEREQELFDDDPTEI